jgi:glycosyltransferase involved in cell wall biosynthesis
MIKIIQAVGGLAPETGGPARSVPNLALALADQGIQVTLLSPDLGPDFSESLVPSHPLLDTIFVPVKFKVGMRSILIPGYKETLQDLCHNPENLILHDHGIWLPQNGIAVQVAKQKGIPLVVSPRGMMEPWAMEYHRWRKVIAWRLFQKRRLMAATAMHATSLSEATSIKNLGINKPTVVIPNGTIIPEKIPEKEPHQRKRILFLSRIHPKKGLLNLVQALEGLNLKDWELIIAGYDENNHQEQIEAAVKKAGLSGSVHFPGPIGNQDKWETYTSADLFILPSFSENFGIVVAEALAAGLPVITTTGTPWEDLRRYNCGWWVEPTVEGLIKALTEATHLSDDQRREMGQRGRKLVEDKYSWKDAAKEMISFYQAILTGRSALAE